MSTALDQATITGTEVPDVIGSVTIDVPGSGTGTQFVKVDAMVTMAGTGTSCPCYFRLDLAEQGQPDAVGDEAFYQFPTTPGYQDSYGTSWVFSASPGLHTYDFSIWMSSTDTIFLFDLKIIATTFPFGGMGGNVLSPASVPITEGSTSNQAG